MRFHSYGLLVVIGVFGAVFSGCAADDAAFVEQYIVAQGPAPAGIAIGQADAYAPVAPGRNGVLAVGVNGVALNLPLGDGDGPPADAPSGPKTKKPIHWSKRRGPAYPDDFWRSFGRDAKELPATTWDDAKAAFTNPWTLVGLGAAGIAGIAISATDADNRVADHFTRRRPQLSKFGDMAGDVGGNPGTHFAVAGAMYFTSLANGNTKMYETSKALINALSINGLTTLALKGIVRTRSPNDDPFGWPSGHTSSTFTLATVMQEAYGPWVGVPLFAFASFVGYERIDARNHDFSDVISGAIIGIVIGHAVMQNHQPRILGFDVIPWSDPASGAVGVALTKEF